MFYAYSAKTGREGEAEGEGRKEGGWTDGRGRERVHVYLCSLLGNALIKLPFAN